MQLNTRSTPLPLYDHARSLVFALLLLGRSVICFLIAGSFIYLPICLVNGLLACTVIVYCGFRGGIGLVLGVRIAFCFAWGGVGCFRFIV